MVELTERPFMAPEFGAEMIDVVWHEVGRLTKTLHFFPNIIILHNHSTRQKQELWDDTYKRLFVIQKETHESGGKKKAKKIGRQIGELLLKKGIIGDSIC
jgi:hypothetical protein